MAKIGRNDPCLCGSGKKYKRCCIDTDRTRELEDRPYSNLRRISSIVRERTNQSGVGVHPYTVMRFAEGDVARSAFLSDPSGGQRRKWTRRAVASQSNAGILTSLAKFGVQTTKADFCAAAERGWSAWELSDGWRQGVAQLPAWDEDFLGLAACELWRRWCSERPSMEMLDDWMQEGYAHANEGRSAEACDRWHTLWETLRTRLEPAMRRTSDTRGIFNGLEFLRNWAHDFADEARVAGFGDPRHAAQGLRFIDTFLEQFLDEDESLRLNLRAEAGTICFLAEQREEGERRLRMLMAEYPDRAIGYVTLSDALGFETDRGPSVEGRQRAADLLEQALAHPVVDAADFDVELRLRELRAMIAGVLSGASETATGGGEDAP